jgi:signal peptidase I
VPTSARDAGGSIRRRWGFAVVRGRSMLPTLHDGDRLLVRYGAAARPGRIAVVRLPERGGWSVKRIGWADADGWWVERDNPAEGVDSWQVGPVPSDAVVAIAVLRVWPRPRLLTRSRGGRRDGRETPAGPQ